jgi:ABC-2 type transport system permease protein
MLSNFFKNKRIKFKNKGYFISIIIGLIILNTLFFRIDLTSDKRYTISDNSKKLMKQLESELKATIYLDGELNPSFIRLKKATGDMMDELAVYSNQKVNIEYVNPSKAESNDERDAKYEKLSSRGLVPTAVYEKDSEGKSIQKIIFPWMELSYKGKTIAVSLLKNVRGNRGEENLNISIENLEFEITDGIRRLTAKETPKIAFLEGHGELSEAETYDISKALSKYFQIDRGTISSDAAVLNPYKVVVIAKPVKPFTESEKFVIDQYIMHGGKVLWLVDGVRISKENLSSTGVSPAIAMDINLNDMLFKYGVRINPVLIQDIQCTSVPVNIAPLGQKPQFEASPWVFSPLLLASNLHPVTKNITEVKAEFCSAIDIVGDNKKIKYDLLLASSDNTHIMGTPNTINLSQLPNINDKKYFNTSYAPVAVLLDGNFDSNFEYRIKPVGLQNMSPFKVHSIKTRQIFVADGNIIRNETSGTPTDSTTLPLGYDRYMRQQFGNKEFIVNAVQYLTDNVGWMQLRNKEIRLRLLNRKISSDEKVEWQIINVITPLLLLAIFGASYRLLRKRYYARTI